MDISELIVIEAAYMAAFECGGLASVEAELTRMGRKALVRQIRKKVGKRAGKEGVNALKPLGLGSTGRSKAENLAEQLAMKEIMSNPTLGKTVMTGMKDSRWLGWSKMQYTHTALDGTMTTIHYVGKFENGVLTAVDDFKFK